MPEDSYHLPVLADETVEWLVTNPAGTYADFTVGGGGHSLRIVETLESRGKLCGLDRDPEAIAEARRVLPERVELWNIRFSEALSKLFEFSEAGFDGILLDLGVSSHQLDEPMRGFSYRFDGPLDLRMGPRETESAADLLARLDEAGLKQLLKEYGEEPQAARIARAISRAKQDAPIRSTAQLASIIRASVAATAHKSLPRVFQALRIVVNREMEELAQGLSDAWTLLREGGRLAVITYHSLEDRPVKRFMHSKVHPPARFVASPIAPPPRAEGAFPVRGPILPSPEEIQRNPRARSAKLRVIEKTKS